jgi:TP901 family phage tail tape measure protein
MPLQLQVRQTGLEKSISEGMKKAGRNLKLNLGNTRNIDALSQPLGRLTGKADEFTKSMEAANARVLAFGASVGVIAAVTKGMQELVRTTIEVEKSMAGINSILRQTDAQMSSFKDTLFDVARNTEQTFSAVAEAALELSRQGLKAEEVTKRLNDALVLSRLSGLSAADSVSGLTAAINSFSQSGITSAEVLNKISAAAASAAVSDRDLIEGLKRSGAVAVSTGVGFDKLLGIIGALQEKTARGGAVIGNSLKTIFTRIQDVDKLKSLQNLGVQVTDLQGNVLSADKVIENLAPTFAKLDQVSKVNLADNLVGKFQIAPFLSLLEQYNEEVVRSNEIAKTSFGATNEAYERNIALNNTLSAALNSAVINMKELGNTLGEIGVTDNLKNVLNFFNSIAESLQGTLDGEGAGGTFAKGLVKGIGAILSGPGLVLLGAVVTKLAFGFVKFGTSSLKTFFGLNQAAKEHANLQGQITSALLNDSSIRQDILSIENKSISVEEKRKQQAEAIAAAMNAQLTVMKQMQSISQGITPSVAANTKAARRASGGFLPIGAESSDIARGVGGAPSSAKPVVIPNFAFGGGKRGTMVANSSEYIVPNYANGGDAIFNQNMASSMGLPANAKKVRAASGYIPNFAQGDPINSMGRYIMLHGEHGKTDSNKMAYYHPKTGKYNVTDQEGALAIRVPVHGLTDANKGNTVNEYIKEYEDFAIDQGFKKSRELTKHLPTEQVQSAIKSKVNSGAVAGFAGSIYELALASMLTDKEFKNYADQTETSNFDLNLQGQEKLLKLYGIGTKPLFGEVKGRNNPENVASAAAKIHRVFGVEGQKKQSAQTGKLIGKRLSVADAKRFGITPSNKRFHTITASDVEKINSKTPEGQRASFSSGKNPMFSGFVKRSASGYIPNFADPLQDAIGREQAAGLPVSQIRINQSGKLRNSQNPMGLAVTNTRDEPTGAIPNFAKGDLTMQGLGIANSKPVENALSGLNKEIRSLNKDLSKGKITRDQAEKSLKSLTAQIKTNGSARKKVNAQAVGALKTGKDLQKGQRDHLGVIFGVQAGLTALTAATGDSTGKLGQLTNAFSDAANTATSFVFAGQALSSLGGNMASSASGFKRGLGGALKGLGTLGMVAGAAVGGFKLVNNVIKELDGTNDAIRHESEKTTSAMSRLEKASDDLTFAFGLVGKSAKIESDIEAKSILGRRGLSEEKTSFGQGVPNYGGFASPDPISDTEMALSANALSRSKNGLPLFDISESGEIRKLVERTFAGDESSQAELKKGFLSIISGFKSLGKSSTEIDKIIDGYKSELDASELDLFRLAFQNFAKVVRVGAKNFQSALDELSLDELEALASPNLRNFKTGMSAAVKLNGIAPNLGKDQRNNLIQETVDERRKKNASQIKTINDDMFKAEIDHAIKIKTFELEKETALERRLKKQKALGRLGAVQILQAEKGIALEKNGVDLEKQMLKLIGDEGIKVKGIAINKKSVEKLTKDILGGETETIKQLQEILEISGFRDELGTAQLQNLQKAIERLKELSDLEKGRINFQFGNDIRTGRGVFRTKEMSRTAVDSAESTGLRESAAIGRRISDLQTQNTRIGQSLQFGGFSSVGMADARSQVNSNNLVIAEQNRLKLISDQTVAMEKLEVSISDANKDTKPGLLRQKGLLEQRQEEAKRLADEKVRNAREKADMPDPALAKLNRSMGQRVSDKFGDSLKTSSQLKDNLIDSSFQFMMNMDQAFRNAIGGADDLGEALLGIGKQFLSDITGAYSKKFLTDSFAGVFGKGLKDEVQVKTAAAGGFISGGSGNKDDVPAMLMGGEFVMRKSAVQKYGAGFFNALNSGGVQGYASGGSVRQRRDAEGMFRTPSSSSGYISGAADLMSFATQSPNRMGGDSFIKGGATAAFLDPESARLSMFGRRNSQQFEQIQGAKRQAFDLAIAEMAQEDEARRAAKESKKQFLKDMLSAAISAGAGYLGAQFATTQGLGKIAKGLTGFGANILGTAVTDGGSSGFGNFGAGYFGKDLPKAGQLYSAGPSDIGPSETPRLTLEGTIQKGYQSSFKNKETFLTNLPRGPVDDSMLDFQGDGVKKGDNVFHRSLFGFYDDGLEFADPRFEKKAAGGVIPNAAGVDTVPTMLSGGEFIMNAAATKRLGAGNLQALNSGSGGGGDNSQLVGKLDELISATEGATGGEINITINSEGKENVKTSEGASEDQKRLSERIKTVVKQVITDEKRLGGQLRK